MTADKRNSIPDNNEPLDKKSKKQSRIEIVFKTVGIIAVNLLYVWISWYAITEGASHAINILEFVFMGIGMLVGLIGINCAMSEDMRDQVKDMFEDW